MAALRQLLIHLRFPFSFFLLPIFLFAWAYSLPALEWPWPLFIILHLLVYPSSNGFNSLMDRDTESIGGIERPQPVPQSMYGLTLFIDALATALAWWFYGGITALLIVVYILASRAYSARSIRLKRFPLTGYLVVVIFQGAWVFLLTHQALSGNMNFEAPLLLGMAASLTMIGASYPLTQVYQHKQDLEDGVLTWSYVLGIRGTFLFAGAMFSVFIALMTAYTLLTYTTVLPLLLLLGVTGPASFYLLRWARLVWQDETKADYHHAMNMSKIGSLCMNAYFTILLITTGIIGTDW